MSVGFSRSGIECPQQFPLHIFCEPPAFASANHHLVRDLLRRGSHKIVGFELQLNENPGEWLLTQIAFHIRTQRNFLNRLDQLFGWKSNFGKSRIFILRTPVAESSHDDRGVTLFLES